MEFKAWKEEENLSLSMAKVKEASKITCCSIQFHTVA